MQEDMNMNLKKPLGTIHIVEEGDTLYKIAKQHDVKLFDIMRLNPYVNVYNLQVGEEIIIPTVSI